MRNAHANTTSALFGLAALIALIFVAAAPAQGQYSIIVSKSCTQTVTKEQARDMFTGLNLAWGNGSKVQVVDQADSDTGKGFYEKFIGKPVGQVRMEWTKLLLSGAALAPVKCADDAAVCKAVAASPTAIGYIASSALDDTVKELVRVP